VSTSAGAPTRRNSPAKQRAARRDRARNSLDGSAGCRASQTLRLSPRFATLVARIPVAPYPSLALHLLLAIALPLAISLLAGRLSPHKPNPNKARPYECGVSEPFRTETRWPVRFALVAMLFLIFDVEALFFYPWAVTLRELGWNGVLAMASFFVVLGTGYLYARSRGALQWK
jgi:NADH-quinone oxidoreductase subunit A